MYLRFLLISLSIFLFLASPAQKTSKKYPKEIYLNEDRDKETKPEQASYLRVIDKINDQLTIKQYYYPSMILHLEGNLRDVNPLRFNGEVKWYYENGSVKQISNYHNGQKAGLETLFNKNGQAKSEVWNSDDKEKIIKVWDESGKLLVKNGDGYVVERNELLRTEMHTFYRDSAVNLKYTIRKLKSDTLYIVSDKLATYSGGMMEFNKFIYGNMNYPSDARRSGIQGLVSVSFIVNTKGIIEEVELVQGFHKTCDDEALRLIKATSGKWTPAYHQGKSVKSIIETSIIFQLTP